ncbi:hypothetical protein [Streptomyces daliensis]
MPLRIAITAEPIPSHVSALDHVIGPAVEQGHDVTLHAPLMFRGEARRRGVGFRRAGTSWTCDPAVQRTASEVWREWGNAHFNRYVFGQLWPERAGAKARDLLTAWTRERPDLVIAECSDPGAQLAATVLGLPLLAADNGLGPVLLELRELRELRERALLARPEEFVLRRVAGDEQRATQDGGAAESPGPYLRTQR